ncbi:MAG: penicillin-binding protein activator [Parvularculales bacterium]
MDFSPSICLLRRVSVLAFITGVVLAGCTSPLSSPTPATQTSEGPATTSALVSSPEAIGQGGRVRMVLLLPLSAQDDSVRRTATAMLDAAQMALFEANLSTLVLKTADTRGTPDGARYAAEEAVRAGADIILGPLLSGVTGVVADVARPHGIPVMAFSSDKEIAGNGVYLMGFPPEQDVDRIIRFAVSENLYNFAAFVPEDRYGMRVAQVFEEEVVRVGGSVAALQTYPRVDIDELLEAVRWFSYYDVRQKRLEEERSRLEEQRLRLEEISQLEAYQPVQENSRPEAYRLEVGGQEYEQGQNLFASATTLEEIDKTLEELEDRETLGQPPYQALLLPEGREEIHAIAPLFPYFDVDPREVQFMGTGLWDSDNSLLKVPPLKGGWYPAPPQGPREDFERRYTGIFGYAPPRSAILAYDALQMVAALYRMRPRKETFGAPRFSAADITHEEGFSGIGGDFKFYPDGLINRALAVYEIRPDGVHMIAEPEFSEAQAFLARPPVSARPQADFQGLR